MYDKLLKTGKVADKDTAFQDRMLSDQGHSIDDPWPGAGKAVHVSLEEKGDCLSRASAGFHHRKIV